MSSPISYSPNPPSSQVPPRQLHGAILEINQPPPSNFPLSKIPRNKSTVTPMLETKNSPLPFTEVAFPLALDEHPVIRGIVLLPSRRIYYVGRSFCSATTQGSSLPLSLCQEKNRRTIADLWANRYAILLIRSTGKRDIRCACAAQLITYDKTAMFMYTGGEHEPMNRVTRTSWLVPMKNHFAGRLNDSRVKKGEHRNEFH